MFMNKIFIFKFYFFMISNQQPQPLNVRDINSSKILGSPDDPPTANTVIGLLKSIINALCQ